MISAVAVKKPSVTWSAAKVEVWPIGRLTANPRNARIHGPEQIEQIRASLREFGWTMPVLVRENGMLIAGHGRLEAAKLEWIAARIFDPARWRADEPLRIVLIGADFEVRVWETLLRVPLGRLTSYSAAEKVCTAKAARAVGAAVGTCPATG